jgi:GWxTD domain-containing protein
MRRVAAAIGCVVLVAIGSACSAPEALDAPDAGRSDAYEPGVPSFDLEAIASVRDGQPGAEVYASFPRTSLVFTATDSSYVARYDLTLRVVGAEEGDTEAFVTISDTLEVVDPEVARTYERVVHDEWLGLSPGIYVVEAVLEDGETGEQAVRRQRIEVAGLTGEPWLSRPLVVADLQRGAPAEPAVALHVPAYRDSLRAHVAAFDAPAGSVLEMQVSELRVDTTVAYPPFWISPSRASLVYRGIDEAAADTLFTRAEPLGADREQRVTFDLPPLSQGIYRLDFLLRGPDGALLAHQRRELSVKGLAFPRLATLAELVDALDYIAYPREMEFIAAGETPQERRRRFDAFWGALVPDRRVAQNLLRLYYERVEEANLLFTSYKPGWKTDRGMIYVIFGAPDYVEESLDGQVWYYGYGEQNPASTFAFERAGYRGDPSPFGHYVLVRQPVYERAWTRAVDRWREGAAL